MHKLSNTELEEQIKEYKQLLHKREKHTKTINSTSLYNLVLNCCSDIDTKNVQTILCLLTKNKTLSKELNITHFYYNNLTITCQLKYENELYILTRIENRVQCESDSSYNSNEASESSEETRVTKRKILCYITKADVIGLCEKLLKK